MLVSDFGGQSVPVFDGLVIDSMTGRPMYNVSLKHASIRISNMNAETLLSSLSGRVDSSFEHRRLSSPNG